MLEVNSISAGYNSHPILREVSFRLAEGSVLRSQLSSGEARVQNGRLDGLTLPPMSGTLLI